MILIIFSPEISSSNSWYDNELVQLARKRNAVYKRARVKLSLELWAKFKKLRTSLTNSALEFVFVVTCADSFFSALII